MNENLQILIIDIKSKRLFGKLFQRIEQYLGGNRKESGTLAFMTSTEVTNRVSASEAVTVSVFPSRLKRKLSRIGKEFLEAITLLIDCKRDNSAVLDTSNLIALIILSCYIIISHKLPLDGKRHGMPHLDKLTQQN